MARPMSNVRQSSLAPPPACALESADFRLSAYSARPPDSSRERTGPGRPAIGSAPAPGRPTSSSTPAGWGASGTSKRTLRASGSDGGHVGTEDTPRGVSSFSSDGGTAAALEEAAPPVPAAGASISLSSPDASVIRLRVDASPAAFPAGSRTALAALPLKAGARRLPKARCCASIARHSPGIKVCEPSNGLLRTLHASHFHVIGAINGYRH